MPRASAIKVLLSGAIFVNDPVGVVTFWSAASIENQSLLHANQGEVEATILARLYGAVLARGFPVASFSFSVGPMPIRIFLCVDRRKTILSRPPL